MRWFKRLFGMPEYETVQQDIPLTTITRWYIYDTGFGNENEIAELVGLTPVSEEGNKKERQDSNDRLEQITEILPFLDFLSDICADSIATVQANEMRKNGLIPEQEVEDDLNIMRGVYKAIAVSALVGGFSISNHLGMVSINAAHSDILMKEEDYE